MKIDSSETLSNDDKAQVHQEEKIQKQTTKTSLQPIGKRKVASKYNINESLKEKKVEKKQQTSTIEYDLPQEAFTTEQLHEQWNIFLDEVGYKDKFIHNAINRFKLKKIGDNGIKIYYPSEIAKKEFEKVKGNFLTMTKKNLKNSYIDIDYHLDMVTMKQEVMTKKKRYEEMCSKNPLLEKLNSIFNFDLNE